MTHCFGSLCMACRPLCANRSRETPKLKAITVRIAMAIRLRFIDAPIPHLQRSIVCSQTKAKASVTSFRTGMVQTNGDLLGRSNFKGQLQMTVRREQTRRVALAQALRGFLRTPGL